MGKKQINKRGKYEKNILHSSANSQIVAPYLLVWLTVAALVQHPIYVVQHCYCAPFDLRMYCRFVYIKINELNSSNNNTKSQRK